MAASNSPTTDQYGLGNQRMLEKIDRLFACGVGEQIDLPQIVVVGDQSSGKSSVLEGLIKKPLPRDSGLCTRFATKIIFRRSTTSGIDVSIVAAQNSSQAHRDNLKTWGKKVASLNSKAFADIMKEVHDKMGLSDGKADSSAARKPTFSSDVLRLEISGPDQEHLSVIDVPGIFRSTTEGITTKDDPKLVRRMVQTYMENPRSVMLAVIPANVDVATQEILEMAHDVDPNQDRTLGVLTKPDLVDKGAEPRVIDLLEGRTRAMKLGWHVIRNPGQMELSNKSLDRDAHESNFFSSHAPWSGIEKDKVGVDALRGRLNEVLSSLVKKEFPKVKSEVKKQLDLCHKTMKKLGPERGSPAEQMAYLTDLATQFKRLASAALIANHGADDVFDAKKALRLIPTVMLRLNRFSRDMATFGATFSFLAADDKEAKSKSKNNPFAMMSIELSSDEEDDEDDEDDYEQSALKGETGITTRAEADINELSAILHPSTEHASPLAGEIKDWLLTVFYDNRGFELGTFNPSILATVMKKQTVKWVDISLGVVSDVIVMVHRFIQTALQCICSDREICRALSNTLYDELLVRYQKALDNTKFLIEVQNSSTPMTLNHYFSDNVQKTRQEKIVNEIKKNAFNTPSHGQVIKVEKAIQTRSISNDEHVILEIHNILKSYYKVSRKTFVDNVCNQAAIHYLLHEDMGPLALFSPVFVSKLTPIQLEEIAGEAPNVKGQRTQLAKQMASLTEAMKILTRA